MPFSARGNASRREEGAFSKNKSRRGWYDESADEREKFRKLAGSSRKEAKRGCRLTVRNGETLVRGTFRHESVDVKLCDISNIDHRSETCSCCFRVFFSGEEFVKVGNGSVQLVGRRNIVNDRSKNETGQV